MRKAIHASCWALNILLCILLLVTSCKKGNDPAPPKEEEIPVLSDVAKSKTGAIITPKEDYEKITLYVPKTFAGGRTTATTAADLTSLMPPIGNQDQQGSCNAFATAYAIKSYLDHVEKKTSYTNSDGTINYANIASPAYVYNRINGGTDDGSRPERAFTLMQTEGVCSWQDMPYNWKDYKTQPSAQQKANAAANKLYGWGRTVISTENFKLCIQEGLPIWIGANVLALKPTGPVSPLLWNSYDEALATAKGYHAMVIVGFDDNLNAFKVMNSWGNSWGNQGFSWLSYDLVKTRIFESYIAFSKSIEPKITKYDDRQTNTGEGTWTKKADLTNYNIAYTASFVIGDTAYVIGNVGYEDRILLTYHPKTNTWGSKGQILANDPSGDRVYVESGGFVLNGRGYLMCVGQWGGGKRLVEYDPAKGAWSLKKSFEKDNVSGKEYNRTGAPMFAYQGKGYYGLSAGSLSDPASKNQKAGELWEYDPLNDSWTLKSQLPIEWCTGAADVVGVFGSKLKVVYSDTYPKRLKNTQYPIYELDLNTGKWTENTPLNIFLSGITGGALNGRLYAGLGISRDTNWKRNNSLHYFDETTSKWEGVTPAPVEQNATSSQAASFIWNNRLYVMYKDADKKYQLWEYKP